MVFDDVVTRESVTTPDMIAKTTSALELAFNLGSQGDEWRRMIGTRYHFNDTYRTMMERLTFKPRIYPATADGTVDGEPVFLTKKSWRRSAATWGHTRSERRCCKPDG